MNLAFTFGWHLDGPTFPEECKVGKLTVGPIGFLSQLALRLGLSGAFPPQAIRIAEYMSRLRELEAEQPFFAASFKTDPWGTTKSLLHLRDELVANGWTRETISTSSPHGLTPSERIKTLAQIERTAPIENLFCLSDLTCRIAEKLEEGMQSGIDSVTVLDEQSLLPPVWQRILNALAANGVRVHYENLCRAQSSSDVSKLTECLLPRLKNSEASEDQNGDKTRKNRLSGDGTFCLLEADDELQAADFLTTFLTAEDNVDGIADSAGDQRGAIVIIRGSSTSILDQFLSRNNLPILGGSDASPLRGYMSILPLCLELCWSPFDPSRLSEFLLLPHCPIRPLIGQYFLKALSSEPGIGGDAWQEAWRRAMENEAKFLSAPLESQPDSEEAELKETEQRWRKWLESPLFDPTEGLPVEVILEICQRIRLHALGLSNAFTEAKMSRVFALTAVCADTLARAVSLTKMPRLPRSQLHRIVESVLSDGYRADEAEASAWTIVDHPGQIYAPADTVIWWGFTGNNKISFKHTWTKAELDYLASHGIHLEDPHTASIREAKSWRRPLLAGARQLLLVKPRTVAGQTAASHPFFHELSELLDATSQAAPSAVVLQAQRIYEQAEVTVLSRKIVRQKRSAHPLPHPKPIWNIEPGNFAAQLQAESPSDLQRLFECPLRWFFKRTGIKTGNLLSAAEGERLSGMLAHAVFAKVFQQDDLLSRDYTSELVKGLTAGAFDQLCPEVAAPLLLPGNSLERDRLKDNITEAAAHLFTLIKDAGYSKIECEKNLAQTIDGTDVLGRLDMLLYHPDNRNCVVDLKWTKRSASHRRRELMEGKAIQLAVYAKLSRAHTGYPTHAAYYMLSQRHLLCSELQPFPAHSYIPGPHLDDVWLQLMQDYKQHRAHLDGGTIFATGLPPAGQVHLDDQLQKSSNFDDSEAIPHPVPGVNLVLEPPCKVCEFGRLCGKKGPGA